FSRKSRGRGWSCTLCLPKYIGQFDFPTLRAALNHEHSSPEHARHVSEFNWWKQPAGESGWETGDAPPLTFEGLRVWEKQTHVDHVFDLVPFWQRAIDAAERGEVLRLEDFLEKMEGDGGWRTADDVWNMMDPWSGPGKGKRPEGEWGQVEQWAKPDDGGWADNGDWATDHNDQLSLRQDNGTGSDPHQEWDTGWRTHHQQPDSSPPIHKPEISQDIDLRNYKHIFVEDIARQEAADEARTRRMHRFFEMPTEQKLKKIQEMIRYLHANPTGSH
ncbi:hypothetical protein BJ138DRAFT_1004067, partial [Hygrophoropsis aurantiaca]